MLLEIKDLSVDYFRDGRRVPALRNLSLSIDKGETVGIAGESGCGKSTLALSILQLIGAHEGRIRGGEILFEGQDLRTLSDEEKRKLRGEKIGIVFQDPFSSLNPVLNIGEQIRETILCHHPETGIRTAEQRTLELLKEVRIGDAERIAASYPHQISGGQRQRALIAMAIANRPSLLIADEPTTALDVSVQKDILELLQDLQSELGMAVLLITHHIGILARYTKKLAVFYAGEMAESGLTKDVIEDPQHPYTRALLKSLPSKNHEEKLPVIPGAPPSPTELPSGCPFHPRCASAVDKCRTETPLLRKILNDKRKVSCHLAPFEVKT
jgi:oligopeptide/dipeptide ABC transporter ATP-binding protein